jgi:hypothetical protein
VAEVRASTGLLLAGGLVVALVGVVSRPRAGGVTGRRIEDAVAPTFANLIRLQRSILGMPSVDVAALRASADCHKVGAPRDTRGAGDWTCTVQDDHEPALHLRGLLRHHRSCHVSLRG